VGEGGGGGWPGGGWLGDGGGAGGGEGGAGGEGGGGGAIGGERSGRLGSREASQMATATGAPMSTKDAQQQVQSEVVGMPAAARRRGSPCESSFSPGKKA